MTTTKNNHLNHLHNGFNVDTQLQHKLLIYKVKYSGSRTCRIMVLPFLAQRPAVIKHHLHSNIQDIELLFCVINVSLHVWKWR